MTNLYLATEAALAGDFPPDVSLKNASAKTTGAEDDHAKTRKDD
jgi:hypothetical protein